jgi:hypothetical protein
VVQPIAFYVGKLPTNKVLISLAQGVPNSEVSRPPNNGANEVFEVSEAVARNLMEQLQELYP